MRNTNDRNSQRGTKGSGFIEICASAFFLVAMVVIGLNIWILVSACSLNDACCRDATRAAAQGSSENLAKNLALATVSTRQKTASYFIQAPTLTNFVYRDFGASTGLPSVAPPNVAPAVTVSTEIRVRPLLPLFLFGNAVISGTDQVRFQQTYTYPLIKTKFGVES